MLPEITNDFNNLVPAEKLQAFEPLLQQVALGNLDSFFTSLLPYGGGPNPFIIHWSISEALAQHAPKKVMENVYVIKDTTAQQWQAFMDLFNWQATSVQKKNVLCQVMQDCVHLQKIIAPINRARLGFTIDLSLAGGALRDFLLMENPQIKDLDIVVAYNYNKDRPYIIKAINERSSLFMKSHGLVPFDEAYPQHIKSLADLMSFSPAGRGVKKQTKSGNYRGNSEIKQIIEAYIFHVVSQWIGKILHVAENIPNHHHDDNEHAETNLKYDATALTGVIKLDDEALHHEVDLLLSNVDIKTYVRYFDFSICKAHVELKGLKKATPKNLQAFHKNIIVFREFVQDWVEKKLTFDATHFSHASIERSLYNHYPRIKKKYPHYQLNVLTHETHEKEALQSILMKHQLEQALQHGGTSKKRTKI